ncbi:MAG: hypothetical protein LH473_02060 [Chitinophagales bacterium]|nr:hypothetical protein [Chitinophagales bacterium]
MKKNVSQFNASKRSIGNLFLLLLCIGLSGNLFLTGCRKEKTDADIKQLVSVPVLSDVIFESNRLKFATYQDFYEAKTTMQLHQRNLGSFERQFTGFKSSRTLYFEQVNSITDVSQGNLPPFMTLIKMADGEEYIRPSVDFQIMGHLTNAEGIVQIESDVFMYTYDNVFKVSEANIHLLQAGSSLTNNPLIQILPIERKYREVVQDRNELAECEWFYQSSGSKKFHCEVKSRIYPGYSQLSVDMDHYKKRLGIWFLNDAPSMSFSGTLRSDCCLNG